MDYIFYKHIREKNMTYIQHFCFSVNLSFLLLTAGIQAFIHSIIPCLFQTSTIDTQRILNMFMTSHDV